jgi:hypothetical protein
MRSQVCVKENMSDAKRQARLVRGIGRVGLNELIAQDFLTHNGGPSDWTVPELAKRLVEDAYDDLLTRGRLNGRFDYPWALEMLGFREETVRECEAMGVFANPEMLDHMGLDQLTKKIIDINWQADRRKRRGRRRKCD